MIGTSVPEKVRRRGYALLDHFSEGRKKEKLGEEKKKKSKATARGPAGSFFWGLGVRVWGFGFRV